jgi:hypothetical protein
MNGIEERLREELKEFAQRAQPESIRPLRAPAPRRRARTARWLAPVAAATAVVAVVAGVTLAGRAVSNRPASGNPAAMPRFYVILVPANRLGTVETANVYDSATGSLLDRVPVPDGGAFGITAAADDRLFAIGGSDNVYLLRLSTSGHAAPLQTLPIDRGAVAGGPDDKQISEGTPVFSPDGRELALTAQVCNGGCRFGVDVLSLAHSTVSKVWLAQVASSVNSLSWSSDGKQVMFSVQTSTRTRATTQYRLLNIGRPAGNLITESRPMSLPAALAEQPALLTPDGQAVVGSIAQRDPGGKTVTGKIVEVSRRTGRLLRVLMAGTAPYVFDHLSVADSIMYTPKGDCNVIAMAASGVQPLVLCYQRFGRIEGGTFTPLPGFPPTYAEGGGSWDAAW